MKIDRKKQGEKDYLEEHSKEKIEFYKKYLNAYLAVLINSPFTKAINIYDVFCGVGLYSNDGSKGSPIVAMEIIKNFNSNMKIKLLINDGDTKRVETAHSYIINNYNQQFEFESCNLLSKEIFELTISKIMRSKNENHFVFIDPHGYKDIHKENIIDIMEVGKSEILIFLPIHMMYRFLEPSQRDRENSSYQPLIEFMEAFDLNYDVQNSKEYIEHIKQAFSFENKYYTTSYILQSNTKNDYALFFITKNLKGLEKAVETKWKLDELCGKGFEQQKAPTLFDGIDKETKKENCLKDLSEKLQIYLQDYRNNNELYEFTLKNGFSLKHINDILKRLQNDDKLYFDRTTKKNAFYINYENYKDKNIKYEVKINE
jgi:three-Cys-motif partner protein